MAKEKNARKKWAPALIGAALAAAAAVLVWLWSARAVRLSVRTDAPGDADRVSLSVVMHPGDGTCAVTERILFRNRTGKTLDHAVVRFYLNAFRDEETCPLSLSGWSGRVFPEGFAPGGIALQGVMCKNTAAQCLWLDDLKTALRVSTGEIAPGGEQEIVLSYILTLPECGFRCGRSADVWLLGGAFATLAAWDGEKGEWRADPFTPMGAPFLSDTAVYDLTVVPGDGWQAAASCPLAWEGGAMKSGDFAGREMALIFFRDRHIRERTFGAVTVRTVTNGNADSLIGRTAGILKVYEEAYGPCPWDTLTVASFPDSAEEMAFPGLIVLPETLFEGEEKWELPLALGAARQWFSCLAASDRFTDPWQDEALCRWAAVTFVREKYGSWSGELLEAEYADLPMREHVAQSLTPGSPLERFEDPDVYETVVCGRGTAFLKALDLHLQGGLNGILRAYADKYAWKRASRQDFEDLVRTVSGQDLSAMALDYLDTLIR